LTSTDAFNLNVCLMDTIFVDRDSVLLDKANLLTDSGFIIRMVYKNVIMPP